VVCNLVIRLNRNQKQSDLTKKEVSDMAYKLEGSMLEVCNCNVLCPCWIGEDPDRGFCDSALSWHFDTGTVDSVNVSGLTIALAVHIPGNVLNGNWRAVVYVDERATSEQYEALLSVFTGKQGGPVADLVGLVGEVVAVERAPITFETHEGKGTLRIGTTVHAELEPYVGATGKGTTLRDTVFSTTAGAPAYVSKAPIFKMESAELGLSFELQNHNAVQGDFLFEG
jgi:hypothetical protein